MTLARLFAFTALIFIGLSSPVQAQLMGTTTNTGNTNTSNGGANGYYGSNSSYQFGGTPGSFGYSNPGSTTVFDIGFRQTGGMNILGCGGIGAFNFMNMTFNMSNVIDQLKKNLTTFLAKQLLIQAMSVPQISAIFDTLNAFGNAKFSLFNQSCNLSSIKKEAREVGIQRCRDRNTGNSEKQAQCQTEFDQDANFTKDIAAAFSKICGFENVNRTIRPTACRDASGNPTPSCWIMAAMDQSRLNLSGGIGGNNAKSMCQSNTSVYGRSGPVVPMKTFADVTRSIGGIYISKAQSQISLWRVTGVPFEVITNVSQKADVAIANRDPKYISQTKTAELVNPANPGFVRLAAMNIQSTQFAGDTSQDAALDAFKKSHGIDDKDPTMDPLLKIRVMCQIMSEDYPNFQRCSIDFTPTDTKTFASNVQPSVDGNAAAAQDAKTDAQAFGNLGQIATTWVLAKKIPIDADKLVELEYKKGPDCVGAFVNGLGWQASHVSIVESYQGAIDIGRATIQGGIKSKQINTTDASGNVVKPSADSDLMDDSTQKAYAADWTAKENALKSNIDTETRAFNAQGDWNKKLDNSACKTKPDEQPLHNDEMPTS